MATRNERVLYCDFCGALHTERLVLVAAPSGAHICNECIGLCVEIVAEEHARKKSAEDEAKAPA